MKAWSVALSAVLAMASVQAQQKLIDIVTDANDCLQYCLIDAAAKSKCATIDDLGCICSAGFQANAAGCLTSHAGCQTSDLTNALSIQGDVCKNSASWTPTPNPPFPQPTGTRDPLPPVNGVSKCPSDCLNDNLIKWNCKDQTDQACICTDPFINTVTPCILGCGVDDTRAVLKLRKQICSGPPPAASSSAAPPTSSAAPPASSEAPPASSAAPSSAAPPASSEAPPASSAAPSSATPPASSEAPPASSEAPSSAAPPTSSAAPPASSATPTASSAPPVDDCPCRTQTPPPCGGSSAAPQPSSAGPEPSSAGPEPSSAGPEPSSAGPEPSSAGPEPSSAGPEPSSAGPGPTSAGPEPSSAGPTPSSAGPAPSSATPAPSSGAPEPTGSGTPTSSGAPQPTTSSKPIDLSKLSQCALGCVIDVLTKQGCKGPQDTECLCKEQFTNAAAACLQDKCKSNADIRAALNLQRDLCPSLGLPDLDPLDDCTLTCVLKALNTRKCAGPLDKNCICKIGFTVDAAVCLVKDCQFNGISEALDLNLNICRGDGSGDTCQATGIWQITDPACWFKKGQSPISADPKNIRRGTMAANYARLLQVE